MTSIDESAFEGQTDNSFAALIVTLYAQVRPLILLPDFLQTTYLKQEAKKTISALDKIAIAHSVPDSRKIERTLAKNPEQCGELALNIRDTLCLLGTFRHFGIPNSPNDTDAFVDLCEGFSNIFEISGAISYGLSGKAIVYHDNSRYSIAELLQMENAGFS